MVCPKCAALVDDELNVCDNCGYVFEEISSSSETDDTQYNINPNTPAIIEQVQREVKKKVKINISVIIILILAILVIGFSLYGTSYIIKAGVKLNKLQQSGATSFFGFSSGNDTAYFVYMGACMYGIGYALRGIGIGIGALIAVVGVKFNKPNKN